MTEQIKRPAGPPRPAPQKPVPAQKRPSVKAHEVLPDRLKTRPPETMKLGRHQMHPIQRRPMREDGDEQ